MSCIHAHATFGHLDTPIFTGFANMPLLMTMLIFVDFCVCMLSYFVYNKVANQ